MSLFSAVAERDNGYVTTGRARSFYLHCQEAEDDLFSKFDGYDDVSISVNAFHPKQERGAALVPASARGGPESEQRYVKRCNFWMPTIRPNRRSTIASAWANLDYCLR